VEVTLQNHDATPVAGTLRGHFGDVAFETPVRLAASETKAVKLDPATHPALRLHNPKLWWPVGYGEASLYPVELKFESERRGVSDEKSFQSGVRQFTSSEEGGALRLVDQRAALRERAGATGAFGESMLRYRAHASTTRPCATTREMNLTMIRNWVGQIGDDAFMKPATGMASWCGRTSGWLTRGTVGPVGQRKCSCTTRGTSSCGSATMPRWTYCGRNEGFRRTVLDDGLRQMLAELQPGLHYIGSSADNVVSGPRAVIKPCQRNSTSPSGRRRNCTANWACRTSSR